MRAVCEWPDVEAVAISEMLAQLERYPEFIFPIAEARIERAEEHRVLLYQRQELFGIADREVLLWMAVTRRDTGELTLRWTAAQDQPLLLQRGAVRTPRNDGSWQVRRRPGGGVRVVHEIAMDAGGRIPVWVIQLVRTRAFSRIMSDVRDRAAQR